MLLLLIEGAALACSMVWLPAPIVSPGAGLVPQGFAIRAGGGSYPSPPTLYREDGELLDVELVEISEGFWVAPETLAEGTYTMNDTLIEVSADVDVPQPELPSLLLIEDNVERVSEAYTASCISYLYRRHLIRTVHVDIPAAEGTGWAVKVTDAADGHLAWMGVDTVPTEQTITLDLGRVKAASEEACLTLSLHSPTGDEVWAEDYPCQAGVSAGCSAIPGTAGLLAGLLSLVGVLTRRRSR